jgi:hypothetical protein
MAGDLLKKCLEHNKVKPKVAKVLFGVAIVIYFIYFFS